MNITAFSSCKLEQTRSKNFYSIEKALPRKIQAVASKSTKRSQGESGGLVGGHISKHSSAAQLLSLDNHAIKIQSACRGFIARKQIISSLLKEVCFLREERDFLIKKANDLNLQDETIARLKKELHAFKILTSDNPPRFDESIFPCSPAASSFIMERAESSDERATTGITLSQQLSKSIWAPHTSFLGERSLDSIENHPFHEASFTGSDDLTYVDTYHMDAAPKSLSRISNCRAIWSPIDHSASQIPSLIDSTSNDTSLYSSPSLINDSLNYSNNSYQQPESYITGKDDINTYTLTNFNYMVDKICKTNDQPSSLFLQHKLRYSNPDVNELIFSAIQTQSLLLMKNRFGNFLLQKVIELGTPKQIECVGIVVAQNVLALSSDRFACHVVQKAIDFVEFDLKGRILKEMLLVIQETLCHKFGCHVWQRLFETEWGLSTKRNPDILVTSIEASLKGKWHILANDENGSLVLQCIFLHCTDEERAPIISQVLTHLVEISMGQWGNWVIQHIVEHGSSKNKDSIIQTLIQNIFVMSVDQYASKVVEKILKIAAGRPEMREIVNQLTRPLSPFKGQKRAHILEMMNNQYGNYVVQHILQLTDGEQRDACVRMILPQLGVLRYSKFGQRVAAIVEKLSRQKSLHRNVACNSVVFKP